MLSFQELAAEPGAPLKRQAANGRDAMHWLQQATVKLADARQTVISANTRMDAAWDAVLMACLAVACAEGWRATSDKGHHQVVLEGTAAALGLAQSRLDELDTLRDWRNRKYRAGFNVEAEELAEAIAWVEPFLEEVGRWFKREKAALVKQGLAP
jgi:tellurite resistance protein